MKILIVLLLLIVSVLPVRAQQPEDLAVQAESAYLMEYSTGKVLFAKNEDKRLFPASMTKMMGLILIYEALDNGRINKTDQVSISEKAASMGGSQIFLQPGEVMSVDDLIKAICIASANDAMVAMAEKVSGSVESFVTQMNEKSKQMNLANTNFMNTTGLHDENHYSSAKDMALIAQALIKTGKDDLLAITSTYDMYLRQESENPFWLVNTNKLIKQFEGADGLKTGFTQEAKSCIAATAKRDQLRFVSVVMKEPDSKIRNAETKALLEYGFAMYDQKLLFSKGELVEKINIMLGNPKVSDVVLLEDASIVFEKGKEPKILKTELNLDTLSLPVECENPIGSLNVMFDDGTTLEFKVGVKEKIEKMAYFDLFFETLKMVLV